METNAKALMFLDKSNLTWLKKSILYLTTHGSRAYGTNLPTSDIDYKGISIPPKEYFLGMLKFEQAEFNDPDCVIYEIRKFFQLATNANPNILEVLFTDPKHHLIVHPVMEHIFEKRDLFVTKRVRFTFAGYAHSQLERIKRHYRWLSNPVLNKPTRKDFNLPERTIIDHEQILAAEAMIRKQLDRWNPDFSELEHADILYVQQKVTDIMKEIVGASLYMDKEKLWKTAAINLGFDQNFIEYIQLEKQYEAKLKEYNNYKEWENSRNKERAELERKYKYDTKHALHLVRLLKMSKEILETGKVIVNRPDAEELLAIRNGSMTYEQILEWSTNQMEELDRAYKNSKLPHSVNLEKINELCETVVEKFLEQNI